MKMCKVTFTNIACRKVTAEFAISPEAVKRLRINPMFLMDVCYSFKTGIMYDNIDRDEDVTVEVDGEHITTFAVNDYM